MLQDYLFLMKSTKARLADQLTCRHRGLGLGSLPTRLSIRQARWVGERAALQSLYTISAPLLPLWRSAFLIWASSAPAADDLAH